MRVKLGNVCTVQAQGLVHFMCYTVAAGNHITMTYKAFARWSFQLHLPSLTL